MWSRSTEPYYPTSEGRKTPLYGYTRAPAGYISTGIKGWHRRDIGSQKTQELSEVRDAGAELHSFDPSAGTDPWFWARCPRAVLIFGVVPPRYPGQYSDLIHPNHFIASTTFALISSPLPFFQNDFHLVFTKIQTTQFLVEGEILHDLHLLFSYHSSDRYLLTF